MKLYKLFQFVALPVCLTFLTITIFLFASAQSVLAKVRVVSSLPTFAAIAEEIGGGQS